MKHFSVFIICVILFFSITGCQDPKMVLPSYEKKECHYSDGFQDYVDYCKYYYNDEKINNYSEHSQFKQVTDEDITILKDYFVHFYDFVQLEDYFDKFDFDYKKQIKKDDYFCLLAKDGYSNFDLYYVDREMCILYYVHLNT